MKTLNKIKQNIAVEGKNNGLLANNLLAIAIFPLLIVFIYSVLMLLCGC
jgi:hypothetical protein